MSNPDPAPIIRAMLALVERADTHSSDGGHFSGWNVMAPPLGVCTGHFKRTGGETVKDGSGYRVVNRELVGSHAKRCQEWREAVEAARAWLARQEIRQLPLEVVA